LANDAFSWYRLVGGVGVLDTTITGDSVFLAGQSGQYYAVVSNYYVTSYTGLLIHSDTSSVIIILPIRFLDFTGTLINNDNTLLKWQTATEINSSYFNVQRSIDGINFTTVGKVNAAGISTKIESYQFIDNLSSVADQSSIFYYRLQEVDQDGSGTLSKVINVSLNSQYKPLTFYPNPVKDVLNISAGSITGNVLINIFNVNGKKLLVQKQQVQQGSHITINTSKFAAGTYFMNVTANGTNIQKKFIKE
jgi:hypothetical protein